MGVSAYRRIGEKARRRLGRQLGRMVAPRYADTPIRRYAFLALSGDKFVSSAFVRFLRATGWWWIFGADFEGCIQWQNINVTTAAARADQVRMSQYDVDCGLRLTIGDNQVDFQARLPWVFARCLELVKAAEFLDAANLCHR